MSGCLVKVRVNTLRVKNNNLKPKNCHTVKRSKSGVSFKGLIQHVNPCSVIGFAKQKTDVVHR